ncbi:MAG: DUF2309 domain-containing protein [Gammaproteobacteria bacterium]|nr:DUF2309 domain-containing protein [Gammaproteobacteria bacterium]
MSPSLGQALRIRAMVYVAGEPVPYFWPMRSFIHHNPLHGLEHLSFAEASQKGSELFHGRSFLPRADYQRYLASGELELENLDEVLNEYLTRNQLERDADLKQWLWSGLTQNKMTTIIPLTLACAGDVHAALNNHDIPIDNSIDETQICEFLSKKLLQDQLIIESLDSLYGTDLANDLDELVIKSCLDFFDEGQSIWGMPKRENGFFAAWREVALRNFRLSLYGIKINHILQVDDSAEGIIAHVMDTLGIPEEHWVAYFTREISRLHGWAGFIRWRENAKEYYWTKQFPADLVDFVAIRLALGLALLQERKKGGVPITHTAIAQSISQKTVETYLRYELYSRKIVPAQAFKVEMGLGSGSAKKMSKVFETYVLEKRRDEAVRQALKLKQHAALINQEDKLSGLSVDDLAKLIHRLKEFERNEGMLWLKAMESHAMKSLLRRVTIVNEPLREKRPFVQALFCIDTRSERIRRHLELVGDYQTFGIAGFFGVPISFMELGKGSENYLCPVILTPKNLVIEMSALGLQQYEAAVTTLEKVMHELKESVLTPFVTVEAIGLLFGFDMIGKTIAPTIYSRWRQQVQPHKNRTRLLLDKITREQADSIIRTVQRAVIIKTVEEELGLSKEMIKDCLVGDLRASAMGQENKTAQIATDINLPEEKIALFVSRLREVYRINPQFSQIQLEHLGRIGFSIDEQANFVSQALTAIGLTKGFSRFILLVGHGSTSDNNPYESALDCGACGGNHGLVNARVIAQMGNKPEVRAKLREQGIEIAHDAWFVPAIHNTTTDEIKVHDLDLIPPSHLVYLDRLRNGLGAASRLCAQERIPSLSASSTLENPAAAYEIAQRNSMDWSQVRPEWGLSRNAYFIIGRRTITQDFSLEGRAFLHSYDYQIDPKHRVLENILTGPLVVGQWINMEHYFSVVDNEHFGSSSKAYHNVVGRFGVMSGNLSDLRTGLPSQTVLQDGLPYHQPIRLITLIEAPFEHALAAVEAVVSVKNLVRNSWIRLVITDPVTNKVHIFDEGEWRVIPHECSIHVNQYEELAIS